MRAGAVHPGPVSYDPGLDRHEWESEMQALEEELEEAPAETLSDFVDLVERMLAERGYDLNDPVARAGEDREIVAEYLAAREVSDRVERGEDVGPGDVASAINGCRSLYAFLVEEHPAS
jgi:hypothetical protein